MNTTTWRFYNIRMDKAPAEGGGGTATAGAGLDPGDINLNDPAFDRLGLSDTLRKLPLANGPGEKKGTVAGTPAATTETPEAKAAREEAEAEAQAAKDLETRAAAAGKTPEVLAAEEQAETERLEAKATELGKTVAEVQALEAEELAAGQPPELAPEAEEYVVQLVAEKDAEIADFKTKFETAQAEAARLQNELAQAKRPPLAVMGVPAILLANTAQEIEQHDAQLASFEAWAVKHWDGSPAVPAANGQPEVPAFTAEQIRARYTEVKEQRAKLVPQARELLAQRTAQSTATKTVYPQLFDSKRPESAVVSGLLQNFPELQVAIPNFHLVAGDAILGESLRKILATPEHKQHAAALAFLNTVPELKNMITLTKAGAGTGARGAGQTTKGRLPVLKGRQPTGAPGKVPRPGAAGAARTTAGATRTGSTISEKNFSALKASGLSERDSLVQMISGSNLPTASN